MGARVYFNRFFSKIDGKGIYDYTQLDTNIDDLEGRLKYIYDLLNITKDAWKLNIQASFFNLTRFFIRHTPDGTFLPS